MVRLRLEENPMLRTVSFALSLFCVTGAHAQVYKCVDSGGKITYSQYPCPANAKSGPVGRHIDAPAYSPSGPAAAGKGADAKAAPGDNAPKTPAEQEQAFRKRLQDQAKAQKEAEQKAAQAKIAEANCRNARERLAQYEIGGRISRVNAQGERYYMDDAQIEQQKASARADIAQSCK